MTRLRACSSLATDAHRDFAHLGLQPSKLGCGDSRLSCVDASFARG
jgi:hypothetical protein